MMTEGPREITGTQPPLNEAFPLNMLPLGPQTPATTEERPE